MTGRLGCLALAAVLGCGAGEATHAEHADPGGVSVQGAWAALPPPGAPSVAAYLELHNESAADRRLLGASSDACRDIEIHRTRVEQGVARMRPEPVVALPAGTLVAFEPGGLHLMCLGPSGLEAGQTLTVELELDAGERLTVQAAVRRRGDAAAAAHGHESHD